MDVESRGGQAGEQGARRGCGWGCGSGVHLEIGPVVLVAEVVLDGHAEGVDEHIGDWAFVGGDQL